MRNLSVISLLTLMILTACGTKGPLYIPEERYPQESPADSPKTPDVTQQTP